MKTIKSGGQDPKDIYDLACSLMEMAQAMKQTAYAMGYDEEGDIEKISEDKESKRIEDYLKGDEPFVKHAEAGEKTYGEKEVEEEEDDKNSKLPIGKKAVIIALRKKFG